MLIAAVKYLQTSGAEDLYDYELEAGPCDLGFRALGQVGFRVSGYYGFRGYKGLEFRV